MTGEWKEYKFQSIIPVHYDENGDLITHEYVGYKCSRCGYENSSKKTNYCPDCGAKMRID